MDDVVLKDSLAKTEVSSVENTRQKHPVGRFLWSAALGDPFITWFFHRKELKKAPKSFFWTMTKVYLLLFVPEFVLTCLNDYHEKESASVFLIMGFVYGVVNMIVQGFIGAKIMKKSIPNYDAVIYKGNERCAVWFLVALFIGGLTAIAAWDYKISLPITIFDLPDLFESIFWKLI